MKDSVEFIADTTEDLDKIASEILNWSGNENIFCFYGEMGAGKTTLIKSICKSLGVEEHTSSPTFALVNEYKARTGSVFHFDFYRIKDEREAIDMGVFEYFESGNYCMIEWPEKIHNLLPGHFVKVGIDVLDNSSRKILITR